MEDILEGAQRGLLMRAIFGQVLTINLKNHDENTKKSLLDTIQSLAKDVKGRNPQCGLIVAFNPKLWGEWTKRTIPIHDDILKGSEKFDYTPRDVLLYLKTPYHGTAEMLIRTVRPALEALGSIETVIVGKRPDARIMGGRYLDSITNPNDPISLTEDILIDGKYAGSCFGFTQKFTFDWLSIASQAPDTQDEMIGRNSEGAVLSQHATRGHVHHAGNVRDSNGDQRKLLRQALPFGKSRDHSGREEGIMFVAFCNEQQRFEDIIKNLLGPTKGMPTDRLMNMVEGKGGGYWYVPAAAEIGVASVCDLEDVYEDPHWKTKRRNDYLFHNSQDYLHTMAEGRYIKKDEAPSARVLSLLGRTFSHWRDGWVHRERFPRLPHLETLEDIKNKLVPERKGLANYHTLAHLLSSPDSKITKKHNLLRIHSKELLVGIIPDFTLGRGKEVVPYLSKAESIDAWVNGGELNEWSAMGHVVPDYQYLVKYGLGGIINNLTKARQSNAPRAKFYDSAIKSIEGVQKYVQNWAAIAGNAATQQDPADADNMREAQARLLRLVSDPPRSFHDAVQLIYSFHCCLHLVGELTSLGRLDHILGPYLRADLESNKITMERAQEVIDCLFIKIGENAFVDRAFIYDYVTYGTTSVCGVGGNFPQGGGINQWVQQITVGGYEPIDGEPIDASNQVTLLFLKAARRIPVNAPTLSLRVHKMMSDELLDEAAKGILSGGAQPILYNDDKLCKALLQSGVNNKVLTEGWSRNYAADGCYEPMFAGASEFAFNNVAPMLALEQTINQGATYGAAGPEQLRGLKQTFRSPPANEIKTFEQLKGIFLEQLEWLVVQCYSLILNNYGHLANVCPSPLLSTLIEGCISSGRDHTDGGPQFHIIAPLCVGTSNTIDSLYAIWKLVYDPQSASTTLHELTECLINDWGFGMIEPYQDRLLGPADSAEHGRRYQELRLQALALPKWGSGSDNHELHELGNWVLKSLVDLCKNVMNPPHPALAETVRKIKDKYGKERPFEFVVTPGIGTFEGYVGDGEPCGASADGRRKGMPIASDLSPVPAPQDLPAQPAIVNIYEAMRSWKSQAVEIGMSNAAPVDMNIPEDFPLEDLKAFVKAYAKGEVGGNLITLTCADVKTYQAASKDPERYNLLRVRMGGWTEFYSTMFPEHQEQHQRRQYFTSGATVEREE